MISSSTHRSLGPAEQWVIHTGNIGENVQDRSHDDVNIGIPRGRDGGALDKDSLDVAEHARVLEDPKAASAAADTENEDNPPKDAIATHLVTKPIEEEQEVEFDEPDAGNTQNRHDTKGLECLQGIREEVGPKSTTVFDRCEVVEVVHEDLAEDG